ncbi:MAG: class I SAM-dependent methyltransferase [Chitinophagaceae bacterium]|nr:class I SAM-dependent methyltransferase [Chitinophagaceae bacterium]
MSMPVNYMNENQAEAAFSRQSGVFDELYSSNEIIRYKRKRVRDHLLQYLKPESRILELNAGTGEDAVFFAGLGHYVHATDISIGMQQKLSEKVKAMNLKERVSNERCSFTSLDSLGMKGPYDCIFSNFAGLNCTGNLGVVLDSFDRLLNPGGIVTLVVLPGFCLWESLLIFKGKFRTATRRFFSSNGRKAKIDQELFTCWYYYPGYISKKLNKDITLLKVEGLCTVVPPSYIDGFAVKYPRLFAYLCKTENRVKTKWPWRYIGDYYIISFRKK